MQELLANYYGMQRGTDRSSDMESTAFDSKEYVRGLLRTEKMETLLRKDDEMVRSLEESLEGNYVYATLLQYLVPQMIEVGVSKHVVSRKAERALSAATVSEIIQDIFLSQGCREVQLEYTEASPRRMTL